MRSGSSSGTNRSAQGRRAACPLSMCVFFARLDSIEREREREVSFFERERERPSFRSGSFFFGKLF